MEQLELPLTQSLPLKISSVAFWPIASKDVIYPNEPPMLKSNPTFNATHYAYIDNWIGKDLPKIDDVLVYLDKSLKIYKFLVVHIDHITIFVQEIK